MKLFIPYYATNDWWELFGVFDSIEEAERVLAEKQQTIAYDDSDDDDGFGIFETNLNQENTL